MNFRFSKCAVALTLALLAASNPKLAQAEEILNTTPASSTEASQAVPVESDTTEEADNTESPVPATTEAENPSSSETAETSDPTSETT
ncbi:2',3'-cyclic-nucleotide 2'-phosphodiesterase, partial [Streptococcus suis]|nr:2',3'-cyclic-nucleotide 2'-phosphodiesterase [Streptococcus suis]